MAPFRDWIPEGEDQGGQGRGFQDFIPTPEPVLTPEPVVPEVVVPEPEVTPEPEVFVDHIETPDVDDILNPRKKGKKNE